jgi:hypothetical protein
MKKNTIFGIIWGAWLGGGLALLGAGLLTIKFWLIFVPVTVFATLEKIYYKDEK